MRCNSSAAIGALPLLPRRKSRGARGSSRMPGYRRRLLLRSGLVAGNKLLVGRVAVALQDAAITAEQCVGVDMPAAGRVAVDHGRRGATTPGPIIAGNGPEIALLGSPAPRIEHRHDRLISKKPCRDQHHLAQSGHHRCELSRRIAHPE